MRVHVAAEFHDLRSEALGIALAALGHEVVSDPTTAEVLLSADPPDRKIVKLAQASRASVLDHAQFLNTTPNGQALVRFGRLLSTVLDDVKGIGVKINEPMTNSTADIPTMLAILELFVPPKKPLELGLHLIRATEAFRRREQYGNALRTLELALTYSDKIAIWAHGEPTRALSSALWLLHPDNTGIALDAERAHWFLERYLPDNTNDVLVHLKTAQLYYTLKNNTTTCTQLERFLKHSAFFVTKIKSDPKLERMHDPAYIATITKTRTSLPSDPKRFLNALLDNPATCTRLYPTPIPRTKTTKTTPTITTLYERELPAPLKI